MALTEKNVYQVEVTENDHVQVRVRRLIMEGGEIISSSLHRHVVAPGQDYSGEIGKVRRMAAAAHVPTVVDRQQKLRGKQRAITERDMAKAARATDDTPETEAAEIAAEQALLDAEAAVEAAEAAHEAFLLSEES